MTALAAHGGRPDAARPGLREVPGQARDGQTLPAPAPEPGPRVTGSSGSAEVAPGPREVPGLARDGQTLPAPAPEPGPRAARARTATP
ncbi:hypothetical protein GCM10011392_03340 [Wenxinia marina]|nr:hypothetical protein GCM10011392_03340 [Wenxinia marina]